MILKVFSNLNGSTVPKGKGKKKPTLYLKLFEQVENKARIKQF